MAISKRLRNIARGMCAAMCACAVVSPLAACNHDTVTPDNPKPSSGLSNENSPLVLATDILDGVFNPFFYTSGADGEIVSQTQIGMLSSNKDDGTPVANWDEPCVAHDFSVVTTGSRDDMVGGSNDYSHYYTDYYFAIKDDIKFSDGVPLTMKDILFNMYMYLDPAYTGSSTMYSVDIQGLNAYRSQSEDDNNGSSASDDYFNSLTEERINCIYEWIDNDQEGDWGDWDMYEVYPDDFFDAPDSKVHTIESDILQAHALFKTEVENDWNNAKRVDVAKEYEKYVDQSGNKLFIENWQVFMYNYGFITLKYVPAMGAQKPYYEYTDNYGRTDHSESTLINYVYTSMVGGYQSATKTYKTNLYNIITYYSTASSIRDYIHASVISHETKRPDGSMAVPTVSGITYSKANSIPIDTEGNTKALTDKSGAQQTYDVLHIRINGVDPKAIQNFSFTVAPGHYYSNTWDRVNINPAAGENYYFGVEFSDIDNMNRIKAIQVPCGAGPYRAANQSGGTVGKDNAAKGQFFDGSIVYFARNDTFMLGAPKIRLLRYKVISNNMLYESVGSEVHFASPSMDIDNVKDLEGKDKDTLNYSYADNLGYGYIGVSARYVTNIYVRRAIMTTLNPDMCVDYFGGDLYASVIKRPMSKTLTDYYNNNSYGEGVDSMDPYYTYDGTGAAALAYLRNANSGCREGANGVWVDDKGQPLKYTFTIAGDSDDHPAARMLRNSAEILNRIGFDITVTTDSQALIKLSSGLLTVWAAAWSSSSDPDMYQVYHKNSNATSTTAWGYTHLKGNQSTDYEKQILNDLADLIDEGREYIDVTDRKPIYMAALDKLMELAVEFPTYQRKVYYIWPKGVFDETTIFTQNNKTYHSPLSEIWKVSFAGN